MELIKENQTRTNSLQRDNSIDILKGIGILCVILGHSAMTIPYMHKFIYTFHMPLFIIVSGYFFNKLKFSIRKDAERMLVPYLFTCILILLLKIIYEQEDVWNWILAIVWGSSSIHNPGLWGQMPNVGTVWFLLSLFVCRFLYFYLQSKLNFKILSITLLVLFLVAAYLRNYISLPFSLLASFAALLFFHIGVVVKERALLNISNKSIFLLISGIVWFICLRYSTIDVGKCEYNLFYLDVISSLFILYIIKVGCMYIDKYSSFSSKCFSYLGRYSMIILCFHDVDLKMIAPHFTVNPYLYFVFQLMFYILCIELARRIKFLKTVFDT